MVLPYAIVQTLWVHDNLWLGLLAIIITAYVFYYNTQKQPVQSNMKWTKKLAICVAGVIAIVITNVLLSLLFTHSGNTANQNALTKMMNKQEFKLFVLTGFIAPVFEETIYRRDIIKFSSKKALLISSIISAFIFAFSHMMGMPFSKFDRIILYLAPACILVGVYDWTKDVRCSMLTHCMYNLLAFLEIIISIG